VLDVCVGEILLVQLRVGFSPHVIKSLLSVRNFNAVVQSAMQSSRLPRKAFEFARSM